MACGSLEIVCHGPVILVAQGILNHVGNCWRDTPELSMAKGVLGRPRFSEKTAVGVTRSLRHHDHAKTLALNRRLYLGQKCLFVEGHFRQQNDVGRIIWIFLGQRPCGSYPASVAPHDLKNKNLGRAFAHRLNIQGGFLGRRGHVLCDGAKPRACVREG